MIRTCMQTPIRQPFTNVQLELLKVFSYGLPDQELLELRKVLARFFAERLMDRADQVWEEQGWDEETVTRLLNTKMRKS